MEAGKDIQKNKISVGLIITNEQLGNSFFPAEIKGEIQKAAYYLLIFISREDVVKISCFPTESKNIKKILIKLEEFSPNLVKGISNVMKDLNLSEDILHTTGLCYEMQDCYYESYLLGDKLTEDNIKKVNEKFMEIPKVVRVTFEDIPSY
ncbi:MAG: hypothetical protein BAJALOKI2v1_170033 [Promethearchaeota archaeon]|nr:MAG: hypothetical protein BAJALOKI2v1_170033 [Candidatus Lokiarchaeota archaeon]